MGQIVRQKQKHRLNHTNELGVSPKTANFPLISVTSHVVKDVESPDGLNIFSMYVPSVGYGTSTVVETKGATDMFAMTWVVKMLKCLGLSDISVQCDPKPSLIK